MRKKVRNKTVYIKSNKVKYIYLLLIFIYYQYFLFYYYYFKYSLYHKKNININKILNTSSIT